MQNLATLTVSTSEDASAGPVGDVVNLDVDQNSSDASPTEVSKVQVSKSMGLWTEFLRRHQSVVDVLEATGEWFTKTKDRLQVEQRVFMVEFYSLFLTTASMIGFNEASIKYPTATDLVGEVMPSIKEGLFDTIMRILRTAASSVVDTKQEAA